MPFHVKYRIYDPGKVAPCLDTEDRSIAYAEWRYKCVNEPLTRLVPEVIPKYPLTKSEEYVWLTYRVLKAIRKYFDERGYISKEQNKVNWNVSIALEKELDDWNTSIRSYLQSHPKSTPDNPEMFAFFEVVELWREEWHKYFKYKNCKDKNPEVEREMKKKCFQMEAHIKKYLGLAIGI